MLRQDDWQKAQLVTFGWLHGKKYGGHLAACMIMSVVMNRVKLGWGTVADVIFKYNEKAGNVPPSPEVPQIWSPEFVRLLHECESIFDGSQDYAKGATYFCDTAEPILPWFKEHVLDEHRTKICDMNSLMFFR